MNNTGNFSEMKRCKTDWLDDIFFGTKESKGTRNAVGAIKLVLFDDYSVVPLGVDVGDKYEFISSKRDGRSKSKMLQHIDVIQILCHYALCSFGIKNVDFTINDETYNYFKENKISNQGYSKNFIIELITFALCDSIYGAYILLASNKFLTNELLDALIEERYIDNKINELDTFSGFLLNDNISYEQKLAFYNAFKDLDDTFLKIKRRDSEYINYERNIKEN